MPHNYKTFESLMNDCTFQVIPEDGDIEEDVIIILGIGISPEAVIAGKVPEQNTLIKYKVILPEGVTVQEFRHLEKTYYKQDFGMSHNFVG